MGRQAGSYYYYFEYYCKKHKKANKQYKALAMNLAIKQVNIFTGLVLFRQGRSHQNLSGWVEIISQGSTYSDFQIIVIVVHSMYSILQGHRNWPGRPGNCRIKVSYSYIKRAHK